MHEATWSMLAASETRMNALFTTPTFRWRGRCCSASSKISCTKASCARPPRVPNWGVHAPDEGPDENLVADVGALWRQALGAAAHLAHASPAFARRAAAEPWARAARAGRTGRAEGAAQGGEELGGPGLSEVLGFAAGPDDVPELRAFLTALR